MKYKQNMLDILNEIKDEMLALEAPQEVLALVDKAKEYFDDYAFEIRENSQEIEILACEIERMTED